jgi:hypothetical protein
LLYHEMCSYKRCYYFTASQNFRRVENLEKRYEPFLPQSSPLQCWRVSTKDFILNIYAMLFVSYSIYNSERLDNPFDEKVLCENSCGKLMLLWLNRISGRSEVLSQYKCRSTWIIIHFPDNIIHCISYIFLRCNIYIYIYYYYYYYCCLNAISYFSFSVFICFFRYLCILSCSFAVSVIGFTAVVSAHW